MTDILTFRYGKIYNIDKYKMYTTYDGMNIAIISYTPNSPYLKCKNLCNDNELDVNVENIKFDDNEIEKLPFIFYRGIKVEFRKKVYKLKSNYESVSVLGYDKEKNKFECRNIKDDSISYYDPIYDFVDFKDIADEIVRKNKKSYYPIVNFLNRSETILATILPEFKNTEAKINGEYVKGVVISNYEDRSKLIFRCESGEKVPVTLDDLKNSSEIKENAIKYYFNKKRSNQIDYNDSGFENTNQNSSKSDMNNLIEMFCTTDKELNSSPSEMSAMRKESKSEESNSSQSDMSTKSKELNDSKSDMNILENSMGKFEEVSNNYQSCVQENNEYYSDTDIKLLEIDAKIAEQNTIISQANEVLIRFQLERAKIFKGVSN